MEHCKTDGRQASGETLDVARVLPLPMVSTIASVPMIKSQPVCREGEGLLNLHSMRWGSVASWTITFSPTLYRIRNKSALR